MASHMQDMDGYVSITLQDMLQKNDKRRNEAEQRMEEVALASVEQWWY